MSRFAAVIFDMDGVLVDGEPLHFAAVNELLAEEGRSISLEAYKPYMGTKSGWTEMVRAMQLRHPAAHYSPRYHELILRQYRERAEPMPGAGALVGGLRRAGLPVAVASSSVGPWVSACLARLELETLFDTVVSGSDVIQGKPAPEIYLLAAERLGVEPAACLAIEDAPAGVAAARAAGMTCWAVRTEYTEGLDLGAPEREYPSLASVRLEDILGVAA